jgi:hypothetical protein
MTRFNLLRQFALMTLAALVVLTTAQSVRADGPDYKKFTGQFQTTVRVPWIPGSGPPPGPWPIAGKCSPMGPVTGEIYTAQTFNESEGWVNRTGWFTLKTKQGDELLCGYDVTFIVNSGDPFAHGSWWIISGVGTFAGATGGGAMAHAQRTQPYVELEGLISY